MTVRKTVSSFLILALIFCFALSAVSFAQTYNFAQNASVNSVIYSGGNSPLAYAMLAGGSLPSGMSVGVSGSNAVLTGTAGSAGTYYATVAVGVNSPSGVQEYAIPVTVSVGNGSAGNNNGGEAIIVATPDNPFGGMAIVMNTPNPNPPVLTKSPTSETIDEGKSAVFVARADNSNFISWYLVSPDMGTRYPASQVNSYFMGVTASGYDSERLVLSNITDALDGWMIEAEFTNNYGTAWSAPAYLTVVKEVVEATPSPTPAPTPTPTPAPTPSPTPATTTYVNGTAVQNGPTGTSGIGNGTGFGTVNNFNSNNTAIGDASTVSEPNGENSLPPATTVSAGTGNGSAGTTRNNSHIGAYILAVVAGLVIIGAILIMALYMKGKINLGGLEKALDNKNGEMFDDGTAYYNPDDFKDNNSHKV